jgi:hypothetical protein
MKHLVLIVQNGFVQYRMNDRMGSHPMGDDSAQEVIDYLIKIINPTTHEIQLHH